MKNRFDIAKKIQGVTEKKICFEFFQKKISVGPTSSSTLPNSYLQYKSFMVNNCYWHDGNIAFIVHNVNKFKHFFERLTSN